MLFLSSVLAQTLGERIALAIAEVRPALIRIHVVTTHYAGGREIKRESAGSGVIIREDGYAVTNHHVVGKAKRIFCTLTDRKEVEAELIGTDPLTDISVIKLKGEKFPYARFGNSDELEVGDYVLAMGSPMALSQSVTMGIVSNTKMVIPRLFWPFNRFTIEGEDVGSIVRWIGHDAPIYGGNSGGPLVNLDGEIVGINEIRLGISGAIPSNLVKDIAQEIIESKRVERAWLGLEIQPLLKKSKVKTGVLISGTVEDSPADRAGFKPGDILIRLGEREVNVRFREEIPIFNRYVMSLPIGKEITAKVLRGDKEVTLKVRPKHRGYRRHKGCEFKDWGLTGQNLSSLLARELKRQDTIGVLVTSIRPGGPVAEAKPSLAVMDVITMVGGEKIKDVSDLKRVTEQILKGKDETVKVLVRFERGDEEYLTVVRVGIPEFFDPGLEAKKAWLGVAYQVLSRDIAEKLGIGDATGVRLTRIYDDTPAEKIGLKTGDIIIAINGDKIPASLPEDYEIFSEMIRSHKIGEKVTLTVLRGMRQLKREVVLGQAPKLAREMEHYQDKNFEFSVRNITFYDRATEKWSKDQKGVLVTGVSSGGWAALAQLGVGDLIVAVEGRKVLDVKSFEKLMEEINEDKPKQVVFQVMRGVHNLFIEIEPKWPEE
ncbi:MAG TPA: PDZ domain-containing protein [bacterium (Candidatus Stahlbacteria)]|nr:PDZ domain-containing protein [Candidatus Stahlbacteria bacterium]